MLSFNDALHTVLNSISQLGVEEKATFNCSNQVLAEDIISDIDLPVRDSATLDGYAVRSIDIRNASDVTPVTLRVLESIRAGIISENPVRPGTAIRIMTGCLLPGDADCVVRFEDTDEPASPNNNEIRLPEDVKIYITGASGSNVRKVGSHIKKGNMLLPKGTIIGPNHISVLMSIGRKNINVIRRPNVAVVSTGDELVNPGYPLVPGKVYNSNTAAVASLIHHYGGIPQVLGIAHDYETSIAARIRKGLHCDAIITSGGVSKGDYDLVRVFMEKYGEIKLSRINMGPGASFSFGMITKMSGIRPDKPVPFFALSGPPSGCMINFETLVRPSILKMMGMTDLDHPSVEAVADDSITEKKSMAFVKWTELRRENGQYHVRLNEYEKKGGLDSIARANSLTIIPEETDVKKGGKIKVLILDWCKVN